MLAFDIDDTISPTKPSNQVLAESHESRRAIYQLVIPTYVLDFLRSRQDIALLSTWGETASAVSEAFEFDADVLVIEELSGIRGKFDLVRRTPEITVWVDDHLTQEHIAWCHENGILAIKPTEGCVSKSQVAEIVEFVSDKERQ